MKDFKFFRGIESEVDGMDWPVTATTESYMFSGSTTQSFNDLPRLTTGNTLNENIVIKKSTIERILEYIIEPFVIIGRLLIKIKDEIKEVFDPLSK